MYGRRSLPVRLKGDSKINVLPHRMPDRTVLLPRERNRALDGVLRHGPFEREMQFDSEEAVRILLSAMADEVCAQRPQRMPPARQRMDDVCGHASGYREGEYLDRRRPVSAVAIHRDRAVRGRRCCGKLEPAGPREIDHRRRLRHATILQVLDQLTDCENRYAVRDPARLRIAP